MQLRKIFERLNGEQLAEYHYQLMLMKFDKKISEEDYEELMIKSSDSAKDSWINEKVKTCYNSYFVEEILSYLKKRDELRDEFRNNRLISPAFVLSLIEELERLEKISEGNVQINIVPYEDK
ncbi:hypothetical protein HN412_03730 [archaeon]|nr:hypothetical protein [archaeon]MBT7192667.1 hypothetical protein [archaeon]MBT7297849.1 hypothetical protein [archaeon]MBT7496985.1 hypothetical protein [Candidatus Woesearchaeota archaeon]